MFVSIISLDHNNLMQFQAGLIFPVFLRVKPKLRGSSWISSWPIVWRLLFPVSYPFCNMYHTASTVTQVFRPVFIPFLIQGSLTFFLSSWSYHLRVPSFEPLRSYLRKRKGLVSHCQIWAGVRQELRAKRPIAPEKIPQLYQGYHVVSWEILSSIWPKSFHNCNNFLLSCHEISGNKDELLCHLCSKRQISHSSSFALCWLSQSWASMGKTGIHRQGFIFLISSTGSPSWGVSAQDAMKVIPRVFSPGVSQVLGEI